MRKLLAIILILTLNNLIGFAANDGFKISLKLDKTTDTVCYLAHYYGDKTYLDDTAYITNRNTFVFSADSLLPSGMYIIAGQNKSRLIEFFIENDDQHYSFQTDKDNIIEHLQVEGSKGNSLFYEYINYINGKQKEVTPLRSRLKALNDNTQTDSIALLEEKIEHINDEVLNFTNRFLEENKTYLPTRFLAAQQEIKIPETPLLEDGRKDSTFHFRYFKAHFFDNLDLSDEALLRSPVYHKKVKQYIEKLVVHNPDSIIAAAQEIISITSKNKETYRYAVWYLTSFTEHSQIMGMDKAFVYLVDNYFANGEMDFWVHPQVKKNIVERAITLRPLLIGKPAPDLIMLDTAMRPQSLYALQKDFTIVFFWDTDCGFCKRETPKLKKFYDAQKDSLSIAVYGVCADTNMRVMKNYIREKELEWINVNGPRSLTGNYHTSYDVHSTPVMYLLNRDKEIIAKRILTDQIIEFIPRYRKQYYQKPEK